VPTVLYRTSVQQIKISDKIMLKLLVVNEVVDDVLRNRRIKRNTME
jgi:hypothetical protein